MKADVRMQRVMLMVRFPLQSYQKARSAAEEHGGPEMRVSAHVTECWCSIDLVHVDYERSQQKRTVHQDRTRCGEGSIYGPTYYCGTVIYLVRLKRFSRRELHRTSVPHGLKLAGWRGPGPPQEDYGRVGLSQVCKTSNAIW